MPSKPMTFGLLQTKKRGYYVPKGDGTDYWATSIVQARAYAVKMIQKNLNATWWDIYIAERTKTRAHDRAMRKPYSSVVFYGNPAGYKWHHDGKKTNMNTDGTLRRN